MTKAPIPEAGLSEVLSKWIGRGQFFESLAASVNEAEERVWTARDLRARAHRLLFQTMLVDICKLPTRTAPWFDALPAARAQNTTTADVPVSGTDWVSTRIRFGWIPSAFAARQSVRSTDMLLVTVLKWTLKQLEIVRLGAMRSFPEVDLPVREQLEAASKLLSVPPISAADAIRPTRQDLRAVARGGRPWASVARLAEALLVLEESPERLISALLLPDDEIRWRLFHLAVLGVLLQALRVRDCAITSLRPISAAGAAPAFRITEKSGKIWSLWFEAAGVWNVFKIRSPYAEATAGMALKERALGADLLLISEEGEALIVECKYSLNPDFVARAGYYQAVGYATELASRLCTNVMAVAVGPDGVVTSPSMTTLSVGRVGVCAPAHLPGWLDEFFLGVSGAPLA